MQYIRQFPFTFRRNHVCRVAFTGYTKSFIEHRTRFPSHVFLAAHLSDRGNLTEVFGTRKLELIARRCLAVLVEYRLAIDTCSAIIASRCKKNINFLRFCGTLAAPNYASAVYGHIAMAGYLGGINVTRI